MSQRKDGVPQRFSVKHPLAFIYMIDECSQILTICGKINSTAYIIQRLR